MSIKKIENLPFEVTAVPQNKIWQATDAVLKPVNIKIRVRNKEENSVDHGVISVPKLITTGSKKLRLIRSDQTIISFDLFMESDNIKKIPKKPCYKIFQLFKPSGCFNIQNDEDVYPYVPNSCNEPVRTKGSFSVKNQHDNNIYKEKFALKKNIPSISSSSITIKARRAFLGKCKPGGCLDPPFSEEKYVYKPKNKMLPIVNVIEGSSITARVTDKPNNSILQNSSSKIFIKENSSHSLITYQSVLSSSEILDESQYKKTKIKVFDENKVRISVNEFSEIYFMPPKNKKCKIDEQSNNQLLESRNKICDVYGTKTDRYTLTGPKESITLSVTAVNQSINQDQKTEIITYVVNEVKSESQKSSENRFLQDPNSADITETTSNIIFQPLEDKNSISDVNFADSECENKLYGLDNPDKDTITIISEDQDLLSKIGINIYENNRDNLETSDVAISILYKDTTTIENVPPILSDAKLLKDLSTVSNNISDKIIFMGNTSEVKTINNLIVNSQQYNSKSPVKNQDLPLDFLYLNKNEVKSEYLISPNEVTVTTSNSTVTDNIIKDREKETDNLNQETYTENGKLHKMLSETNIANRNSSYNFETIRSNSENDGKTNNNDQFIETKNITPSLSVFSLTKQIENLEIINLQPKELLQNIRTNDRENTLIANIEKNSDKYDIVKQNSNKLRNKNNNVDSFNLNNFDAEQIAAHKMFQTVTKEFNTYVETELSIKQTIDTDRISVNNHAIKESPPTVLGDKISSTSQLNDEKNDSIIKKDFPNRSRQKMSTDSLKETIIKNESLYSIVSVQSQPLKNTNTDDLKETLLRIEKTVDKKVLENKSQLQLPSDNEIMKAISILSGNNKAKEETYSTTMTFDETLKNFNQSATFSTDFHDLYREPNKFDTLSLPTSNLKKYTDSDKKVWAENRLQNKSSSIGIDLGFYTLISDKNEITIKTFDTSKNVETGPLDKVTIIKSMIRKDGSEIRIPINPEMDISFQIKKTDNFDKDSVISQNMNEENKTEKSTLKSMSKDNLLQETLTSVYENLVPVKNTIRNLRQEADLLMDQQVLLKNILNTLKIKPARIIHNRNKCNCYKI